MARRASSITLALWLAGGTLHAVADEPAVLANLRDYFQTADATRRAECVARIESDSAYDRAKVAAWLAQVDIFEPLEAGRKDITVPIDNGREHRSVTLRIPNAYDPQKTWPLIYAFHGSNGDGASIIQYLEHVLAGEIDEFVIAAPTGYTYFAIQSQPPISTQHLDVLLAVKELVRIDSDRVYLTGYSRGGHASWSLGVLHADQLAGVMPLAGSLILPEVDKLWDVFLPNLAHTHVLAVWGENDRLIDDATLSEQGGIAGLNRKMCPLTERLKLPVECVELEGVGHGNVAPPAPELRRLLKQRRAAHPAQVRHVFRHAYQASAYWLEGREWTGQEWGGEQITMELKPGEDPHETIVRTLRSRLGHIEGMLEGNTITLKRKSVKELVVWIEDGMIDWDAPVVIKSSGRKAFDERLTPSLATCLSEAARTYDFQRLRWAGVRVRSGGKADVITP